MRKKVNEMNSKCTVNIEIHTVNPINLKRWGLVKSISREIFDFSAALKQIQGILFFIHFSLVP